MFLFTNNATWTNQIDSLYYDSSLALKLDYMLVELGFRRIKRTLMQYNTLKEFGFVSMQRNVENSCR